MMNVPIFTKTLGHHTLRLVKNQMFLKRNNVAFLKKIKMAYAFKFIVGVSYH